jgi:tRNA(Ile)-lysidine synthase
VRAGAELRLRFAEQKRGHVTDYEYRLEVPGSVMIRETNLAIEASFTNGAGAGGEEHLADPRKLPRPLVVRPWRAGERFRPQHSKETKKIKELLQDRHITGDAKKLWPVVASGAEIVWVRGLGVSEDFRSRDGQGISILEQDSTSVKTLSARAKKGPSVT